EKSQDERRVMKERDDGGDAVAERRPAEVAEGERDEQHDHHRCERDRPHGVVDELAAEGWADDLVTDVLHVRAELGLDRRLGHYDLIGLHLKRADLDAAAFSDLDDRLVVLEVRHHAANFSDRRRRVEPRVEQRAAFELDARPQATEGEKDHAGNDEQQRQAEIPPLALDELDHRTVASEAPGARGSGAFSSTPYRRRRRSEFTSMAAWSSICVTMTAVKNETPTPIARVSAKPFTVPVPNQNKMPAVMIVARFEYRIDGNARRRPSSTAARSDLPARSSSLRRSNVRTFAST